MELFRTPSEDFLVSSAAGSMWTLLAVLTAAVGLWRIRFVGIKSNSSPSSIPLASSLPLPSLPPSAMRLAREAEEIKTTKERFTMVYSLDSTDHEESECCGFVGKRIQEEAEDISCNKEVKRDFGNPLEQLELMSVKLRNRSDLGWYCYQDRMAINGSVVRLWCGNMGI